MPFIQQLTPVCNVFSPSVSEKNGQGKRSLVRGNTKKYNEPMTPSPGTIILAEYTRTTTGIQKILSCDTLSEEKQ